VQEFEHAGVAAIALEDQVSPKRCGHFEGKAVISRDEMVEKLNAAVDARSDPDLVLVARTDSVATDGIDEAISRSAAYIGAGADVIFIEAPRTLADLERITAEVDAPCLVNIVEGGKTPLANARDLERMGFRLAVYANLVLRVAGAAVENALVQLKQDGTSEGLVGNMWSWGRRQEVAGLPAWEAREAAVASRSSAQS
jgi:2-methylisocitrate lyase-like PEP mutase family enzyme